MDFLLITNNAGKPKENKNHQHSHHPEIMFYSNAFLLLSFIHIHTVYKQIFQNAKFMLIVK